MTSSMEVEETVEAVMSEIWLIMRTLAFPGLTFAASPPF